MSSHKEQEFLQQVRKTLDQHTQQLDVSTSNALKLARQNALQKHIRGGNDRRTPSHLRFWYYGFTSTVTAAVIVLVLINPWQKPVLPRSETFEDLAIVSSDINFEFYQEMDFYAWLLEQDSAG